MANDAIKFLGDIQSSFRSMKVVTLAALAACAFVCAVAVVSAMRYVDRSKSEIFILDEGAVLEARRAENNAQRDLEALDHVTRFHELFFNIAPNITMINQNISRALDLADESAYKYYNDLREQRYFTTLIDINATQQISVDSVKVDIMSYPYRAVAFASLYVARESNVTQYAIRTQCELTNVARTAKNPHGLMIHKFYATKPEFVETRARN